jgi:ADP-dependent NAD(P)H-hydrate dehydratase / NAD(P)H-hydrate epimerase
MRGAWPAADIRVEEQRLIETLPELTLMQRAAAGLARRCADLLAGRAGVYGSRVLLLIGAGNNGGDALFAGAMLARRGVTVQAMLLVPDRTHEEGLTELKAAGGRVTDELDADVDLILDGILGIGAQGTLRGPAVEVVGALGQLPSAASGGPVVVSVDLPSGVSVDSGAVEGPAVRADVTVTFGCLKTALVVGPAAPLAGHVEVVDIGLPPFAGRPTCWVPDLSDVASWLPRPGPGSDKYTRGVAGLATGSKEYPGAAIMSVAGALAGPAGMVRYAGEVAQAVSVAHPSAVVAPRAADAGRVQAWLCGCGLGTDGRAQDELRTVLGASVPVVLDADALTLIGQGAHLDWLLQRDAPTVVTPHDREFTRLAGAQVGPDRLAAARELAARLGVVVLLKGDRTVVAAPDGTAWANPTGSPALATAGTGDVLAGLLVSLLAGGVPADRAAIGAAFLHGLAGRAAAVANGGTRGPVTAPDVANELPKVIAGLT